GQLEANVFASLTCDVPDNQPHSREYVLYSDQSDSHDTVAEVAKLSLHQLASLLQFASFTRREHESYPAEAVLQTGSGDDQFANNPHEVVKPPEVHAHEAL